MEPASPGVRGPLGPPGSRPSCVSLRQAGLGPLRASPACKYKLQYGRCRVYYIRFALLRATCFTTCLPGSMLPLARKFEPCRWRHGFDTVPQQPESARAPQAKKMFARFLGKQPVVDRRCREDGGAQPRRGRGGSAGRDSDARLGCRLGVCPLRLGRAARPWMLGCSESESESNLSSCFVEAIRVCS